MYKTFACVLQLTALLGSIDLFHGMIYSLKYPPNVIVIKALEWPALKV